MMCRGGKIVEQAVQEIRNSAKDGRIKDALRTEVGTRIIAAISKY
jgi:hypothetical protein